MATCERIFCLLFVWLGWRRWVYAFKAPIHSKLIDFLFISVTGTVLPCKFHLRDSIQPLTEDIYSDFRAEFHITFMLSSLLFAGSTLGWMSCLFADSSCLLTHLKVFFRNHTGGILHELSRSLRFGEIPLVLDSANSAILQDFFFQKGRQRQHRVLPIPSKIIGPPTFEPPPRHVLCHDGNEGRLLGLVLRVCVGCLCESNIVRWYINRC